ncbi:MAG: hypothetical protein P8163_10360, partial [Candidatus Thiodiazotropha sp.]
ARLKNAHEVGYELDMGMGFEVPLLGRVKIPVNYKGKVPIPEIPLGQRVNYNLSGSMQASSSNPILKSFHIPLDKQGKVDLNESLCFSLLYRLCDHKTHEAPR